MSDENRTRTTREVLLCFDKQARRKTPVKPDSTEPAVLLLTRLLAGQSGRERPKDRGDKRERFETRDCGVGLG